MEGWIIEVERFLDDNNLALVAKTFGNDDSCTAQINANGLEYAEILLNKPDSLGDQTDTNKSNYFEFRDGMFSSLKHGEDVLGARINRVEFSLHDFTDNNAPVSWVDRALDDLEALKLIKVVRPPSEYAHDEIYAGLTDAGEKYYWASMPDGEIATEAISSTGLDEHGKDDIWEPLKIDRETTEYGEAVAAVEEALGVITRDNGYAASTPDERGQVIWSIREGLRAIRENLPSRAQIQSMVVQPLRYISKRFTETAMGEIAKKALGYLFTWLAG